MSKYCECKFPIVDTNTRKCYTCKKINKSLNLKIRKTWKINPRTRIKKSKKIYDRKKQKSKQKLKKEE